MVAKLELKKLNEKERWKLEKVFYNTKVIVIKKKDKPSTGAKHLADKEREKQTNQVYRGALLTINKLPFEV